MASGPRSATTQPRQPKGVRTGGQFAEAQNPESSLSLEDGALEARRQAQHFIRRYGLANRTINGYMDADDLTQDAVMAFVMATKTEAPIDRPLPIGIIAKRAVIRALDGVDHKRHAAVRLLEEERRVREVKLGRRLEDDEFNALAAEIRESLPVHHRPSEDFHRPKVLVTSLDEMAVGHDRNNGGTLDRLQMKARTEDEAAIDRNDFAKDSAGDRATLLKMDGAQVQARALAWDAIAEFSGAPLVAERPVGKRAAIRARAEVADAGGPQACAERFLDTGKTQDALFVPFGYLDTEQKIAVCDVLVRNAHYADDLWKVAISRAEGRASATPLP